MFIGRQRNLSKCALYNCTATGIQGTTNQDKNQQTESIQSFRGQTCLDDTNGTEAGIA